MCERDDHRAKLLIMIRHGLRVLMFRETFEKTFGKIVVVICNCVKHVHNLDFTLGSQLGKIIQIYSGI